MTDKASVQVLHECIELQLKKSADYQNPNSSVKQADYYPNGVMTIHDILHAKMLRARSLLESRSDPNNESLEDTYKDLINYASFAVAWLRKGIPGQGDVDAWNRPVVRDQQGTGVVINNTTQVYAAQEAAQEVSQVPTAKSQRERAMSGKVPSTSSANMYR